jgi:hypothetical protein
MNQQDNAMGCKVDYAEKVKLFMPLNIYKAP